MTDLKNDLILRAARGEKTERTPVWLMRQAGRILPEYRQVRASVKDFIELVKSPDLVAEVTIQPVDHLDVDAAIIFSDILVIPEALGLPYIMEEGRGPLFPATIENESQIDKLNVAKAHEELSYVYDSIELTKKQLAGRVPLIGFAGAPWTIMAYMVEGKGSKTFSKAKAMLYQNPKAAEKLLDAITNATIQYLKLQIKSGANMVQIFDSWAGILSAEQFEGFALKYISKICDAITEVPVTVFAKGANATFEAINKVNCRTVGLDWNVKVPEVRRLITGKTLQGNLDPCALYSSDEEIIEHTQKMMEQFKGVPHIANLGYGVYPDIDPNKVKVFIETVKGY